MCTSHHGRKKISEDGERKRTICIGDGGGRRFSLSCSVRYIWRKGRITLAKTERRPEARIPGTLLKGMQSFRATTRVVPLSGRNYPFAPYFFYLRRSRQKGQGAEGVVLLLAVAVGPSTFLMCTQKGCVKGKLFQQGLKNALNVPAAE